MSKVRRRHSQRQFPHVMEVTESEAHALSPGTDVRLAPHCNWRRSHNFVRARLLVRSARTGSWTAYRPSANEDHIFVIRPSEIEAVYVNRKVPEGVKDQRRVARLALEYLFARADREEFELSHPNNTTRDWESLLYAEDHVLTALKEAFNL